jgi:hypothetical protein
VYHYLGACIVHAMGPGDAARQAHLGGCNPGGEAMIFQLPPDATIRDEWKNVLLSKADMKRLGM